MRPRLRQLSLSPLNNTRGTIDQYGPALHTLKVEIIGVLDMLSLVYDKYFGENDHDMREVFPQHMKHCTHS